jgi:hypothetical protein
LEYFFFGLNGEVLGIYDFNGDVKQEIIWLNDKPIGVKNGSGAYNNE